MLKKISVSLLALILIPLLSTFIQRFVGKTLYHILNPLPVSLFWLYNLVSHHPLFIGNLCDILTIIILFIIFLFSKENLIKRCRFKKFNIKKLPVIFLLILGVQLITIGFLELFSKLISSYTIYPYIQESFGKSFSTFLGFFTLVILGPICEEIIFRGALFTVLRKRMPLILALILQALSFSLYHDNLVQSSYVFFGALVIGGMFVYTNSLFGDIIAHMLNNFLFGFICFYLIDYLHFHVNPFIFIILGIILMISAYPYHLKFVKQKSSIFTS